MQLRLEWVPSYLESSCGSCCPGRRPGPSPALVCKALPPPACWLHLSLAGLRLAHSLHLFFGPRPDGHHLWQAASGCLGSHSRSRGAKPCPPLAACQGRSFHPCQVKGVPGLGPVGPHSSHRGPKRRSVSGLALPGGGVLARRTRSGWGLLKGRGWLRMGPWDFVNGEGTWRWLCQAWLHALHSLAGSRLLVSQGGGGWAGRKGPPRR